MRSLISIEFPVPEMEPDRTCGISCLRSLNAAIAIQHHPGNIHQSVLLRLLRYSVVCQFNYPM